MRTKHTYRLTPLTCLRNSCRPLTHTHCGSYVRDCSVSSANVMWVYKDWFYCGNIRGMMRSWFCLSGFWCVSVSVCAYLNTRECVKRQSVPVVPVEEELVVVGGSGESHKISKLESRKREVVWAIGGGSFRAVGLILQTFTADRALNTWSQIQSQLNPLYGTMATPTPPALTQTLTQLHVHCLHFNSGPAAVNQHLSATSPNLFFSYLHQDPKACHTARNLLTREYLLPFGFNLLK